jgi:hypothetical protein
MSERYIFLMCSHSIFSHEVGKRTVSGSGIPCTLRRATVDSARMIYAQMIDDYIARYNKLGRRGKARVLEIT